MKKDNVEVSTYKRTIKRNQPFLLLGNEIDGRIFCDQLYQFKNFLELREKLPFILPSIKGEGEWCFELYQVPKDYRIWHRYGYYKYPNRGTKLLTYNYLNLTIREVVFKKKEFLFVGATEFEASLYIEVIKLNLTLI